MTKLNKEIFCEYQDKFDINYWKLDGMLLNPSTEQSEYYVTGNPLYTISETYERWTDIFEDMRDNRAGKDLWLNMTSYTNPSPWHVQWVNSVWMQNTGDTGYTNSFNAVSYTHLDVYKRQSYERVCSFPCIQQKNAGGRSASGSRDVCGDRGDCSRELRSRYAERNDRIFCFKQAAAVVNRENVKKSKRK